MPFTLSHAVLAPPLSKLTGNRLPVAALAIGCMVPDLYRLFVRHGHDDPYLAHYWSSLLYPDLMLGLGFSFFWYVLYRPVIYRFCGIQHPLNIEGFCSAFRFILGTVCAVLIGVCTHILWDGLTHADFRTVVFKSFLAKDISLFGHIYPLHRTLQIGTSIVVLPILAWMLHRYYRHYQQYFKISKKVLLWGWGLTALSILSGFISVADYLRYFPWHIISSDLYHIIGISFNEFTQTALIVFTLGCVLFLFLDRNYRLG